MRSGDCMGRDTGKELVKIRNAQDSQWDGRRELFEAHRDKTDHRARLV